MITAQTFTLSNSFLQANFCYDMINRLIELDPQNENLPIYLESLTTFLQTIVENSTPEYWSDDEYEWIEGVLIELQEEPAEEDWDE
jgi:hypothetical protein